VETREPKAVAAAGVTQYEHGEGAETDQAFAELWEPLGQTVQITLPIAAMLPESYVPDMNLRLQLYRRMARLRSEAEIGDMKQELEDRFGPLPEEALDLLFQLRLKVLALAAGVDTIAIDSDQIVVRYGELSQVDRQSVSRKLGGQARLGRHQAWLELDGGGRWRETLVQTLEVLSAARQQHVLTPA
jgi:transcription-repair coupling factor (superfamily II helicase)